jgi:hypothetical protein
MRLISVATCRRSVSTAGIRKIPQRSAARKWKVEMQFVHAAQIPSKEVSADSADLSPNSLERYLDRDADGNWQGFVLGPETDHIGTAKSRLPCVDIHAHSVWATGGHSEDDHVLFDLNERYKDWRGSVVHS